MRNMYRPLQNRLEKARRGSQSGRERRSPQIPPHLTPPATSTTTMQLSQLKVETTSPDRVMVSPSPRCSTINWIRMAGFGIEIVGRYHFVGPFPSGPPLWASGFDQSLPNFLAFCAHIGLSILILVSYAYPIILYQTPFSLSQFQSRDQPMCCSC